MYGWFEMSADIDPIEPFIERVHSPQSSAGAYRLGYRIGRTKDVLSSMIIQAEAVGAVLAPTMVMSARMGPAGDVAPTIVSSGDTAMTPSFHFEARSIESLVADAVDENALRLEEGTVVDLEILLGRLKRSVAAVTKALARFG
jgi:hypothetical protein